MTVLLRLIWLGRGFGWVRIRSLTDAGLSGEEICWRISQELQISRILQENRIFRHPELPTGFAKISANHRVVVPPNRRAMPLRENSILRLTAITLARRWPNDFDESNVQSPKSRRNRILTLDIGLWTL